ncbi:MAG TPA: hypothetical protein VG871_00520 [Vicinamibacterales bacterium]|nr:hypothetical protein [Vicinamibacterales bacterium]
MSQACPACGAHDVHHSRFRSLLERLRFNLTGRVPYRCHQCDWRGWRQITSRPGEGLREVHKQLTDDELDGLDPDQRQPPRQRGVSRP